MNQATLFDIPTSPAPRVQGDEIFPEEMVACRACGAQFIDLNGKRLCDTCLVDRVNGAGELELDDPDDVINQPALRFPDLCTVVCAVCGLSTKIRVDAPARLCGPCTADLQITRNHVAMTLEAAQESHARAVLAWAQVLEQADATTLARWDKAEAFIKSGREADPSFRATWERERSAETALGAILRAYETYTAAERAQAELRAWGVRAMQEIESAEEAN